MGEPDTWQEWGGISPELMQLGHILRLAWGGGGGMIYGVVSPLHALAPPLE